MNTSVCMPSKVWDMQKASNYCKKPPFYRAGLKRNRSVKPIQPHSSQTWSLKLSRQTSSMLSWFRSRNPARRQPQCTDRYTRTLTTKLDKSRCLPQHRTWIFDAQHTYKGCKQMERVRPALFKTTVAKRAPFLQFFIFNAPLQSWSSHHVCLMKWNTRRHLKMAIKTFTLPFKYTIKWNSSRRPLWL